MRDKIKKFENILTSDLEKEMDRIIAAKTMNPQDVKIMDDAIELMLKTKELEGCFEENEYNSYSDGYSMRRGRSMTTGRYVSRDSMPDGYSTRRSYRDPYDYGYSGHSINDRMVSKLEDMYDEAKNEHERQVVDEWINRISSSR